MIIFASEGGTSALRDYRLGGFAADLWSSSPTRRPAAGCLTTAPPSAPSRSPRRAHGPAPAGEGGRPGRRRPGGASERASGRRHTQTKGRHEHADSAGRCFIATRTRFWSIVFGRGLDGERYVVEKLPLARPDGQIQARSRPKQPKARKGRRRPRRTIVSAGAVRKMRPERDEIIICTALDLKASGGANLGDLRLQLRRHALRALSGGAGHARRGPREGERQRPPAPAACCPNPPVVCARRCARVPPEPGLKVCASCGEKRRAADKARRERARARGASHAGRDPVKCRRADRAADRRRRRARRDAGLLFTSCGRNPPADGRAVCEPCGEAVRAADRARYAARRAAGVCVRCTEPADRRLLALRPARRAGSGTGLARAAQRG